MNPKTTAVTVQEKGVEYTPLGNASSIRLSITIVKHYLCTPSKSGKLCSDREAVRFMMLCKSRGLDPFQGDAFLLGYDSQQGTEFSLITAHQAFLKRAETHKEFDGIESGVIVQDSEGKLQDRVGDFMLEDDTLVGAWANVHFKTRKFPVKERIALKPFDKGFGRWKIDPAGMLVKCCQSSALRTAFPTLLCGLYLRDEIEVRADATTLPGTGDIDLPPVTTVDTGNPEPKQENGAKTEPDQEKTSKPAQTPQGDLQAVVEDAGYNFNDFQGWLGESGNFDDARSLPSFDAVPKDLAARLLRAKAGLLDGISRFAKGTSHGPQD